MQAYARLFICLELVLTMAITGNFTRAQVVSLGVSYFIFRTKWLLFKRLDFSNRTGPMKVRIDW